MEPSGSGAEEPDQGNRIQEPAEGRSDAATSSNAAPTAAPPPPPATPHRQLPGGGRVQEPAATSPSSNGNGAPTAVPPPPPPPTGPLLERPRRQQPGRGADGDGSSSPEYGAEFRDGAFVAGESSGSKGVKWSDPVVAGTTEVPALPLTPFESRLLYEQAVIEQLVKEQSASDEQLVKEQVAIERMVREEVARDKEFNARREQLLDSMRAEEALYQKEKENLPPVKEEPKQKKLPQVKRKSLWSQLKKKIFHRERREICSEHVAHQTHPITEVRRRYKIPLNTANHLDAYSECRAVIGDGDCFYRSFIFSYLEQVIDRQDTDEERRLLDVVKRVSTQHANLRWISEFPSSSRVFKKLIKKVMKWKRHGRWNSMESTSSYRKEKLLKFFSTYDKTKDIFVFLRLVVAIQMCSHKDVYVPLIVPRLTRDTLEDVSDAYPPLQKPCVKMNEADAELMRVIINATRIDLFSLGLEESLARKDLHLFADGKSYHGIMGLPMAQTVPDTCSIVAPAKCIEMQHRRLYEALHGTGSFICRAAAPRKLRASCRRAKIWVPKKGAKVEDVLNQIMKLGGIRTMNVPTTSPGFLPLESWEVHRWGALAGPNAYDVADLLDTGGPFICSFWVAPWYYLMNKDEDNDRAFNDQDVLETPS